MIRANLGVEGNFEKAFYMISSKANLVQYHGLFSLKVVSLRGFLKQLVGVVLRGICGVFKENKTHYFCKWVFLCNGLLHFVHL